METKKIDPKDSNFDEMEFDVKCDMAIRFIKSIAAVHNCVIAYSGGKDSVILDFLVKEANVKAEKIYNNTTIDPKGTISFCQKHGATISRPKISFLDLVEKKGFPTMFRRFCCKELKEKYIADYVFYGIRKNESVKRNACYSEFDDVYYFTKKIFTNRFFPLLYFTEEDEKILVERHSIEMHPLYYDEDGQFCADRRLGCIGCPLQGDRGRNDFINHPVLLKQILRRGILYHRRYGRSENDAALNFVYNVFYSNNAFHKYSQAFNGLFENNPWDYLYRYFGVDKDDVLRLVPKPKFG